MIKMDSMTVSPNLINSVATTEISFIETNTFNGLFKYIALVPQYLSRGIYGFNLWALLFIAFFIVLNLKNTNQIKFSGTIKNAIIIVVFLIWSMISFTEVVTYIYSGF